MVKYVLYMTYSTLVWRQKLYGLPVYAFVTVCQQASEIYTLDTNTLNRY